MVTATLTPAVGRHASAAAAPVRLPLHHLREGQRLWADRLLSAFQGQPITGVEWAMKFSATGLVGNRFTLGMARAHWHLLDWDLLAQVLAVPPSLWQQVRRDMAQAGAALFAFEPGNGGADSYRIYLERLPPPEALRQPGVLPLGRGYKWQPATGREVAVTDYRMRHLASRQAFAAWRDPYLAGLAHPVLQQVAERIIAQAVALADPCQFMLLEVNEADTRRDSFALTFRGLELPLRGFIPDLLRLACSLALNESDVLGLLVADEPRSLYSLAAGMGRDGHEFLTVYYD